MSWRSRRIEKGSGWELARTRWQDEPPVHVDVVIGDWPFSARTHEGQRTGSDPANPSIDYDAVTPEIVEEAAQRLTLGCRWWFLAFTDHVAGAWWEASLRRCAWVTFAPIPCRRYNPAPRLAGDGPASEVDWLIVARPKGRLPAKRAGHRPGFYQAKEGPYPGHPGAKSLDLMRAIVRDYTIPGDTILDPVAGSGTTLIAAATEGRKAIGYECDPAAFDRAARRLVGGHTPVFPGFER